MRVSVLNRQDRPTLSAARLRDAAAFVLGATGAEPASVGVAWVDDARMIEAHACYLDKPVSTDVLSFPSDSDGDEPYCGDIMICTDQAQRQALALGHPYDHELMVLFVHGLLHLLGFDHTRDRGEMRRLEEAVLPRCIVVRGQG